MNEIGLKLYRTLSSLRLSVYLLGFGLVLVFFGTLDQVHYGIYETQRRYFQSLIAFWHYPAQWPLSQLLGWIVLPMPGGYAIGPLFIANLAFAHFRYFKPRLKTVGIVLIHAGFGLLLVGQLLTDIGQKDYQMWIDEGGSSFYGESFYDNEIVLIDHSDSDIDRVWSIAANHLRSGEVYQHPELDLSIRIQRYFLNSRIMQLTEEQEMGLLKTSHGIGNTMRLGIIESRPTYAQNERNITTSVVEVLSGDQSLGTWLISNVFGENLPKQQFEFDGRKFTLELRFERKYLPFRIKLKDFSHDKYPGTEIPKNFSSLVDVEDFQTGEVRESLIYMNNPLRYGGYTFYQASFGNQDRSSMLQVVRNPGWMIPYLACVLMSLGMLYQFGWTLVKFAGRVNR